MIDGILLLTWFCWGLVIMVQVLAFSCIRAVRRARVLKRRVQELEPYERWYQQQYYQQYQGPYRGW